MLSLRSNKKGYIKMRRLIALLLCLLLFCGLTGFLQQSEASATAPNGAAAPEPVKETAPSPAVADASQMTTVKEVVEEGMVPVTGDQLFDGGYPVKAESSSSMFRITESILHVADGKLSATIVMSGKSYLYIYPGTAMEAATADEHAWIPYFENGEGAHCFTIPVEALDTGVPCAAFSRNKELWYDRTLLFRADSLPSDAFQKDFFVTPESLMLPDGDYLIEVSLSGGSGRAKVESPTVMHVKDGSCTAEIVWGSKNYDYMKVEGEKFLPISGEGNSRFEIPVRCFDRAVSVIADTVAMSEPHEIEYCLLFNSESIQSIKAETALYELNPVYARNYRVELQKDGTALLTLGEKDRYLLINRDAEVLSTNLTETLPVILVPAEHVYAASSSVPDLFLHCDAMDSLRFTGTNAASWHVAELQDAMNEERLLYAGKYSAPDYELLLEENCDLVIENTMILHNPEAREKLETLGIPVLIEYSSYEPHPLGRVEWIRLYGLLTGHRNEADRFFEEQQDILEKYSDHEPTGKTVAFFHLTENGTAVVRKSADYVTRMIEFAGGESPFHELPGDDSALSTVSIGMESFYEQARDADVLIYNSTITGDLKTIGDLLEKSSLFSDFRAVRTGEVWCTGQSMFQQSSLTAEMIADLHSILSGEADERDELTWLHRVK